MFTRFIFFLLFFSFQAQAQHQNSDKGFAVPLKDVLLDIEKTYKIRIKFDSAFVSDKTVKYAQWRYRTDVDVTLSNILSPLDMKARKEKEGQYKLGTYEYYRWDTADGWNELNRIAAQYSNLPEWEARKTQLKPCLLEALRLSPMPPPTGKAPIVTPVRKMNGYTVQNIALEIFPGLFVNGSLYKPASYKGKIPVILNPDGHWADQRYRPDCQLRCASLARMGTMAFSYDLFAWGESLLQFEVPDHRKSLSMTFQTLAGIRILDYLLTLPDADITNVGIVGGSGGGSHTVLMTAIDDRITHSAPVVSLSSYFYGGCPCESGMPIHFCGEGTNNVELAAMAAPRPQLVVSDGGDWTNRMPEHDFIYLQKMYGYFGKKELVTNVHLPNEGHDFGINKRKAVYDFFINHMKLDAKAIYKPDGQVDESKITIEPIHSMYVFGPNGEHLPQHAIKGFAQLEELFNNWSKTSLGQTNEDFKVALIDLMLLKRQKLGAIPLAAELGADGLVVDMGGLGNRIVFENQLRNDTIRKTFVDKAKEVNIEIFCLAMTGYYAQSFCNRESYIESIEDCITTMKQMNVKMAFLPLGVQCDLRRNPEVRDSVVARLKVAGKMAEKAGVTIAIETALTAAEEVKLLKDIGSNHIKICFNFSNPLKEGRDLHQELKALGKENMAFIHATNKDSVWLQNDPEIDMIAVKKTLQDMGWKGWLVIERSRDATKPRDVKGNFGANTAYLKKVFQETKN